MSTLNEGDTLCKEQEEILDRLKKLWEKYPQQRLGQLIYNSALFPTEQYKLVEGMTYKMFVRDYFHVEDQDVLKKLRDITQLQFKTVDGWEYLVASPRCTIRNLKGQMWNPIDCARCGVAGECKKHIH